MSKGGPRFGALQQGRGDAVGAVSGLEQQRQVKSSLCGTDWPAVGSRGLEAVCSALCLGRLLKGPCSCRRMAAKKKEGVLQVSSSQAFSRSCKLSVSAKDGVQSWGIPDSAGKAPLRGPRGEEAFPQGRWEAWEDLAGHTCPLIRAVGCRGSCCTAAGCVWGCWGLAQVWLSGTKMPLFCEVIAQRTFRSRELGLAHLLDGKSYWAFLGRSCIQKDCCKGGKARRYKKNSKAEKSISQ